MKKILLFTRTTRVAGAEKVVNEILQGDVPTTLRLTLASISRSANPHLGARGVRTALFGRFDLIHTHLFLPAFVIRIRRIFDTSFEWVHTVHYATYKGQRFTALKRYVDRRLIYPNADKIIAVGKAVAAEVKPFTIDPEQLITISNCVRQNAAQAVDREFDDSGTRPKILLGTVSMLRTEKGVDDLIHALAWLRARGFQAELRIAGDGPERGNIERLVRNLNLQDSVHLFGYVQDIPSFFRSLDMYVCASKSESFGIALVEAMQYGLPIVASDAGEIPEMLKDGRFGLLIPRAEIGFAERLGRGIEAISQEMVRYRAASVAGREFYREQLLPELFCRRHYELYAQMLRPKVCMISPLVTHAKGGIQQQLKLQSRALSENGYRVFILQKKDPRLREKKTQWPHARFLETPTLPDHLIKKSRLLARVNGALFIVFGLSKLWSVRSRLSVIHAHQLFSPATLGVFAKYFLDVGVVVKVTASGEYGELNELKRLPFFRMRNVLFRKIDRVLVLTDDMETEMKQLNFTPDRISLVPNSVELRNPVISKRHVGSRPFRILYTGRLSIEKSLETLIFAAYQLAREGFPVDLFLVGGASNGGRDCEELLRQHAAPTAPGLRIFFEGAVDDVQTYYVEADAFVLPSLSEGMSNSLLEAMSNGLACVASSIPANQFVISDGLNGLLFEPGNARSLAAALRRLVPDGGLNDELRRSLGIEAHRTISRRFSVDAIAEKLMGIYRDVAPRSAQRDAQIRDGL